MERWRLAAWSMAGFRLVLAEGLGTFLFFFVGIGAALSIGAGADPSSSLIVVALAHGIVLAVLVSALAAVSGAHFNPAVSLALAARGQLPGPLLAPYILAQLLGESPGITAVRDQIRGLLQGQGAAGQQQAQQQAQAHLQSAAVAQRQEQPQMALVHAARQLKAELGAQNAMVRAVQQRSEFRRRLLRKPTRKFRRVARQVIVGDSWPGRRFRSVGGLRPVVGDVRQEFGICGGRRMRLAGCGHDGVVMDRVRSGTEVVGRR